MSRVLLITPVVVKKSWGEESWECSKESRLLDGTTLQDYFKVYGEENCGTDTMKLLTKVITTKEWLSVQVHPNDHWAQILEGESNGKTESWYIMEGESRIVGDSNLGQTSVKAGDYCTIPAGTVHALGPGLMAYEVQQYSDLTYRLYDWPELYSDRGCRELHLEKAAMVIVNDSTVNINSIEDRESMIISETSYYRMYYYRVSRYTECVVNPLYYSIILCVSGSVKVSGVDVPQGRSALILNGKSVVELEGDGSVILTQMV